MPLTNAAASYVSTMREFAAHWKLVNADLASRTEDPLLLANGYALAAFEADIAAFVRAMGGAATPDNARAGAASSLIAQKKAGLGRLRQFNGAIKSRFPGTEFDAALPDLPSLNAGEQRFCAPFETMNDVWRRVNALAAVPGFTPPLKLPGGFTLINAEALLAGLHASFQSRADAGEGGQGSRARRDALKPLVRARLRQYVPGVVSRLESGNPLLGSLPPLNAPKNTAPRRAAAPSNNNKGATPPPPAG